MVVHTSIKDFLKNELIGAIMIWIASAIVSKNGLKFIQDNIGPNIIYLELT